MRRFAREAHIGTIRSQAPRSREPLQPVGSYQSHAPANSGGPGEGDLQQVERGGGGQFRLRLEALEVQEPQPGMITATVIARTMIRVQASAQPMLIGGLDDRRRPRRTS